MKKSFKGGFDEVLLRTSKPRPEPFKKKHKNQVPYHVATLRIEEPIMDNIKRICHWDSAKPSITVVVNKALKDHISEYVKKHGDLKPMPEETEYNV